MADDDDDLDDDELDQPDTGDDEDEDDADAQDARRGKDLSKRKAIREDLIEMWDKVTAAYRDQWERANDQKDFWAVYECRLTGLQFYNGTAQIYVPIVKNAVDARQTRYTNQIFPVSGRYIESTSSDGTRPDALSGLLEHYVRKAKLRTRVMPPLIKNGDVEGQYNVLVSWRETKRHVTHRVKRRPESEPGIENPAAEMVDDIKHEVLREGRPETEVLADADVLVLPQTSDSIEEALADGGSVTIIRRFTKAKIKQMIKSGVFREDAGESLMAKLDDAMRSKDPEVVDMDKHHVDAAGIKGEKGKKFAQVYLTYTYLDIRSKGKTVRRICECWYGGEALILGARRNPLWCDRVPLLSVPVAKVAGSFKGVSKVKHVAPLQYAANDAINEAWDSAAYALMPIVLTDPAKNPRVGSMILSMSAIWETSPKDTQVMQFPQLWQHGFEMVNACKAEVSQTLNVSPAAITQGVGSQFKHKQNQAMVAQENQIDILTTADAVTIIEEGILTPMVSLFLEMDHQYRDDEIEVRAFGEMGLRAQMERIPPIQMDKRYQFRWFGVEQVRNQQLIQQQIAAMNVVRQIPAQQLKGPTGQYEMNLVPIVTQLVENTFGPRLAPQIFIKPADQMPIEISDENLLLAENFEIPIHKLDDHRAHIAAHMPIRRAMMIEGKPTKYVDSHIYQHIEAQKMMDLAAMGIQPQQPQQQQPPPPGGRRGQSRPGAQTGAPRGGQGPAGMIPRDQMHDARASSGRIGPGPLGGRM